MLIASCFGDARIHFHSLTPIHKAEKDVPHHPPSVYYTHEPSLYPTSHFLHFPVSHSRLSTVDSPLENIPCFSDGGSFYFGKDWVYTCSCTLFFLLQEVVGIFESQTRSTIDDFKSSQSTRSLTSPPIQSTVVLEVVLLLLMMLSLLLFSMRKLLLHNTFSQTKTASKKKQGDNPKMCFSRAEYLL